MLKRNTSWGLLQIRLTLTFITKLIIANKNALALCSPGKSSGGTKDSLCNSIVKLKLVHICASRNQTILNWTHHSFQS